MLFIQYITPLAFRLKCYDGFFIPQAQGENNIFELKRIIRGEKCYDPMQILAKL